jgi:hypothetical protein
MLKVFAVNACFACAFHANSHYLNVPHWLLKAQQAFCKHCYVADWFSAFLAFNRLRLTRYQFT